MHMGHKFKPASGERLVGADRRALLEPTSFVHGLGITPGATVADLSAGPGFFTTALADASGRRAGFTHSTSRRR